MKKRQSVPIGKSLIGRKLPDLLRGTRQFQRDPAVSDKNALVIFWFIATPHFPLLSEELFFCLIPVSA
jgi:hypothetical protein